MKREFGIDPRDLSGYTLGEVKAVVADFTAIQRARAQEAVR